MATANRKGIYVQSTTIFELLKNQKYYLKDRTRHTELNLKK